MRLARLSQFALAPLALAPTLAFGAADPAVSSFTLPNGLMGVVIEDHRAPVVTSMVWYKVGAADDPYGETGLAHFLEHLMFKATDTLADGEFSAVVAANGGDENAFTSADYTAYFQNISADRLDLVLRMEADRMVNLDPGEAGALSERDVVREERRQRVDNSPEGPFRERQNATLYLNSPYGRPIIGWAQELEAITLEGAMAFYRAHYAPNNAVLVVAGDVTPARVEELAAEHFGPIPASDLIEPRNRPREPEPLAARRIEHSDPRVTLPVMTRSYLAPPRRSGDQREAAALAMLAQLFGRGATSEMTRELELGPEAIAVGTGAYYNDVSLDPSSFSLRMALRPGVEPAEAEARLDALIADFIAGGPDEAGLERARNQVRASEIYARDSVEGRANEFGQALTSGLTIADVEGWPEALLAVTAADVQAAARAVFDPDASVTGWLLPERPPESPTEGPAENAPENVPEKAPENAAANPADSPVTNPAVNPGANPAESPAEEAAR
ncbi:M16 family metallopeptidase [Amaricoccus sp. W119]|uniref:M16 family metallopeptidase n=1 Tax=Amaricoccus sp. W119 TaxID=3391833 RepID=UPI0039A438AD